MAKDRIDPEPPVAGNEFDQYLPAPEPVADAGADFGKYVDETQQQELQPLAGSLYAASRLDPERRAKVLATADESGLDPDLVDRNLEYFRGLKAYDDQSQGADMATILHERPDLAKWLTDRDNAAISRDDLPALKRLSDYLGALNPPKAEDTRAKLPWLEGTGATLRKGYLDTEQMVAAIPALVQHGFRSLFGIDGEPGAATPLGEVYRAEDIMRAEQRAWQTYQESTAQKLVLPAVGMVGNPLNALPIGAGAKATADLVKIGMVAREAAAIRGAAGAMGAQTAVQSLGGSMKTRQEAGEGAGGAIAPTMADLTHAGFQGALAYAMGRAGGLTGVLRSLRDVQPTVGQAVADIGTQAVVGGTQGIGSETISSLYSGRALTPGEAAMSFLGNAIGGGALASAHLPSAFAHQAAARLMDKRLADHQAVSDAQRFAGAAVALVESKTNGYSQTRTKDLMDLITSRSGQQATGMVFAQGETWDAYWKAAGLDPEAVATSISGDPTAYARAMATGGQIEMPQASFLSKLAGTEHFAKILNDVSLAPGAPTLSQAAEGFKTFTDDLARLQHSIENEIESGVGQADPTGEAVFQDIFEQRIKSGATTEVAKTEARLWQAAMTGITRMYNAEAKTSGAAPVNASDLFRSLRLTVKRELPKMLREGTGAESIEPLLNELRAAQEGASGKAEGRPADALDALKEIGGIAKRGDRSAQEYEDRPKHVKLTGEHSPDAAAKMLQERGFGDGSVVGMWKLLDEAHQARQAAREDEGPTSASYLPAHLKDLNQALKALGIDLAHHADNESVFATIRERAAEGIKEVLGEPAPVVMREVGHEAATDAVSALTQPGHFYRGMTDAEYQATLGSGKGVVSRADFSVSGEGTSFTDDAGTAESYVNFGRDDPRKTGKPTYLVEVAGNNGLKQDRDGYFKAQGEVGADRITRVIEMRAEDGKIVGRDVGSRAIGPRDAEAAQSPVTLEQGARLNAPEGGSLHKADLLKLWRKAFGDRSPDESSMEWRALVEASRMVDQANGREFHQGQRGTITFGDLATTIRLFESADLSTFSHESAHAWLGAFASLAERGDAPAEMQKEWATVLKWLGVKSGAEIGTKQHEQWAESWEHYLLEGKAPSAELRGPFARIKAWMLQAYSAIKQIYRSTGGKVMLTDEMRGVFDRMLASRDEIAAANEADSADPLFMSAEQAGMTAQDFASYQKRALAERQRRQDVLERKLVSSFLKEKTKLYRSQRTAERERVADAMNQRRDLTAVTILQHNRMPNGEKLAGPGIKLDKAELEKLYPDSLGHLPGAGSKRENQNNRGPMVYATEGGLPLDVVAEYLRYHTGSELFHDLVNAPDLHTEIDRVTDQHMREKYPDPMTDGTIAEKVIEATHEAENRAAVLDDEAQALGKRIGSSPTPRQVIKTMAEETIGKRAPVDIRPQVYRIAEAKAAREAFNAVAAGDFDKALVAKQRQQVNHELVKAAVAAKAEALKIRDHLVTLRTSAARERIGKAGGWEWTVTRPDGQTMSLPTEESARSMAEQTTGATFARTSSYLDSIDRILATVELRNVPTRDLQNRELLARFEADQQARGIAVDLPRSVVDRGAAANWRELSINDLRGINDAVRNIEHAARDKNKALADQRAADFAQLSAEMAAAIVKHSKGPKAQRHGQSIGSGITDPLNRFIDNNRRVADLILRMNGGDETGGALFWNWQYPLNQAGDREGRMQAESTVEMMRLLKAWNKAGPLKSIGLNRQEAIPGTGLALSKLGELSFALNYGNLGNRERLLSGLKLNEAQARVILDRLDKADWAYVNGIVKHIDSYWSEIAALEQRVHGVAPSKVEAAPFMTKHGEQPGGYFPISYDRRLSASERLETSDADVEAMLGGMGASHASTAQGHTEERGKDQGRPINLDFGVAESHLTRVIKDLAQRETLMRLNRLHRSREFSEPMISHWGQNAYEAFGQQLRSSARGATPDESGMGTVLGFFRRGANASRRALSVAYALKQIPGMFAAIPRLGLGNVVKALGDAFNPKAHAWADEHSTSLKLRGQERLKQLSESVKATSPTAIMGTMERIAYLFAGKAWKIVDTHAWYAGLYKAMKLPEVGGDLTKARAIADQIMNDTQGGFLPKDMPQILRGGGELGKLFTNNMSWANANFMLMANSLHRFAAKGYSGEAALHMVSDMLQYLVVAPAIYLAASDALDGEIGDWEDPEVVKSKVLHEGVYTLLGSLPILRELSNAVTDGRRAESLSGASGLGEIINLTASIHQDVKRDDGAISTGTLRNAFRVGGIVTHFPAPQVLKMLDGWTRAEENGENPVLPVLLGRPPK